MSLSEALKQTRANRAARRQSVIDAMKPIKKALLEYKRNLLLADLGIKPKKGKSLGHYRNRICFDVANGAVVLSTDSEWPGTIYILHKGAEMEGRSLESALLHVAELMTESA